MHMPVWDNDIDVHDASQQFCTKYYILAIIM